MSEGLVADFGGRDETFGTVALADGKREVGVYGLTIGLRGSVAVAAGPDLTPGPDMSGAFGFELRCLVQDPAGAGAVLVAGGAADTGGAGKFRAGVPGGMCGGPGMPIGTPICGGVV